MKEMSHDNRPSAVRTFYLALRQRFPLENETATYIVVSAMDVLLTYYLLNYNSANGQFRFVESNPIPQYFLGSWGDFAALVYFKFALVALVAVICQFIARTKIEVARRVLNFASIVVTGVVVYSVVLMVQHT
jgi:hypothetical protein